MRILIIDDSALMRRELSRMVELIPGSEVRTARDGRDGLQMVRDFDPDVVTLDINMPEMDGLTCLSIIMTELPRPVIMVSSLTSHGALATFEALELGAVDFIEKPGGTVSINARVIEEELRQKVSHFARDRQRLARMRPPVPARRTGPPQKSERVVRPNVAGKSGKTLPFPALVVVGSSTGGPAALDAVLSGLPGDLSAPVVIAQHIPEKFSQTLANRLDSLVSLHVMEVTRATVLEAGKAYIGMGGSDVRVATRGMDLIVQAVPATGQSLWVPSVDRLVRSAGAVFPADRIVGVLLTGMGDDGAASMAELHKLGATTIAESEESAVVWGMPGALVKMGGATEILPLNAIGSCVARRCYELA